jgi:hypothetical protein
MKKMWLSNHGFKFIIRNKSIVIPVDPHFSKYPSFRIIFLDLSIGLILKKFGLGKWLFTKKYWFSFFKKNFVKSAALMRRKKAQREKTSLLGKMEMFGNWVDKKTRFWCSVESKECYSFRYFKSVALKNW